MSALAEMYVQGVSTRKVGVWVKAVTEELCGHTFSARPSAGSTAWMDCSGALPNAARRGVSLSDPRCAVREGPARRGDPVAGSLHRDRDQRPGAKSWAWSSRIESRARAGRPSSPALKPGGSTAWSSSSPTTMPDSSGRCGSSCLRPCGSGVTCTSSAMPSRSAPSRRRLSSGVALALRPAQSQRGRAGSAGVAHALGDALSQAHRLGRSTHRRDVELLQPAASTPQASEEHEQLGASEEIKRPTRVVRIFPNAASCYVWSVALCAETHRAGSRIIAT